MIPYEYTDDTAETGVKIFKSTFPGTAVVAVRADGATGATRVPAAEVPAAALAMYEAAGLPEPVILPRPDCTGGIAHAGRTDRYAYTSRVGSKVAVGWRSIEPAELDPDEALEFAAHIAVNALAAKAAEPDPAEIERLSIAIGDEDDELNFESRWSLARAILLGGWKREPES